MYIVCLGLLLSGLTWAAPTVQPQTEKTKQDCVEEQRITHKSHHEKRGYYIFKSVYMSSERKNQTNVKQEGKNKDNVILHHSGKRRTQESAPKENIVQERKKDLFLLGVNKNNQINKAPSLFEHKQIVNEDYSISNNENAHNNLKMPLHPESTGNNGPAEGDNVISELCDQEEYGAALNRNNMQNIMEPETVTELLREENKEIKSRNVESKIPAGVNYAKDLLKGKKNYQRDRQAPNIPAKSRSAHNIQHKTDSLKQFPKLKKVPSDFEGSGYPDLQERGDHDLSPFSGDGQPVKGISGKGEASAPDLEGTDIRTEFSGPGEAESANPEAGSPGYNDIPEKVGTSRNTSRTRDETAPEANAAGVSLLEGSNDIAGSTNFKELPGKEGNRVDASSQNAHQGKVEFHFPHVPSKEKRKGSSNVAENSNYNEIPKNGRGSSRKGTDHSDRNYMTSNEKQRFPGQFIPSQGLDNGMKNEIGSHSGPNKERTVTTHSGKNHYAAHRQNSSTWNKGVPQGHSSWGDREPHPHRRAEPLRTRDSSESADSSSSSESDGD